MVRAAPRLTIPTTLLGGASLPGSGPLPAGVVSYAQLATASAVLGRCPAGARAAAFPVDLTDALFGHLAGITWPAANLPAPRLDRLGWSPSTWRRTGPCQLPIAGCTLAAGIAGGLADRKRPFSMLRLTGARLAMLRRVVAVESAVPLPAVGSGASGSRQVRQQVAVADAAASHLASVRGGPKDGN